MKQFTVYSSHGELTVDAATGDVIKCDGNDYIADIKRFDLEEHKRFNSITEMTQADVDILDFAYWNKDGSYDTAEDSWRAERLEMQKEEAIYR